MALDPNAGKRLDPAELKAALLALAPGSFLGEDHVRRIEAQAAESIAGLAGAEG